MKKVNYTQVIKAIDKLIKSVGYELEDVDFVCGISRGGLFPAMLVATKLNKPLVVAYIDKKDIVYFDRSEWIREKKVLLVDDIVRTGKTLFLIKNLLTDEGAKEIKTLTIYDLISSDVDPDYSLMTKVDIRFPWD